MWSLFKIKTLLQQDQEKMEVWKIFLLTYLSVIVIEGVPYLKDFSESKETKNDLIYKIH